MSLPRIAIVGRPNVGKSSLLNRLARRRVSIVDPTPGVTRDRVSTIIEVDPPIERPKGDPPRMVEFIDTGGYGVYTAEGQRFNDVGADLSVLTGDIERQIAAAVDQADVILFVTDATSGVTSLDETIATMLREHGRADRVIAVANKVDDESWEAHGLEVAGLGFGQPQCVSAANGYGIRDMIDRVYERIESLPESAEDRAARDADVKLAIVGKRNAGKSTLVNAMVDALQEGGVPEGLPASGGRVIVSEIAGTTRDAIDVRIDMGDRSLLAIDTAGLRKRKSFADDIEYYAYRRMLSAIRRADVAVLLIDATSEVSQVDQKLAQELQRQFKPTVIAVNKWDLIEQKATMEDYEEYLTRELRGLDYAPIVFISAKDGEGIRDVVAMAHNLHEQASHRESTGRLNALFESIMAERGPSSKLGTQAKLYYASQVETNPPTIVAVVNRPELFEGNYERFLMNRLRDELPYSEVPIRLVFSERKRKDLAQMKEEGRERERGVAPPWGAESPRGG